MFKFSFIYCLLFAMNSVADFSGMWGGEGYYATKKSEGSCSDVFFKLKETNTQIDIVTGGYTCSTLSAEYPYSKFQKNNGKLFYKDSIVGEYSENRIVIAHTEEGFTLTLEKVGELLVTKEEWRDDVSFLVIKSHLEREE